MTKLRRLRPEQIATSRRDAVDADALAIAGRIVGRVREGGLQAVQAVALELGDVEADSRLMYSADELQAACDAIADDDRALLERSAARIQRFAEWQLAQLHDGSCPIEGGEAGHEVTPVATAGCYAPGGRFPLPSSVLMTAVTARVAGVETVWVASPRPAPITLAAAAIAGADSLLACGGAQAIAALAYGADPVPRCDVVVGPGNRFVTAAKQLVAGQVGIDMLAGPSELVVLADDSADAHQVAADLLAQAEHDPDAVPILVTTHPELVQAVETELAIQLAALPDPAVARQALAGGFAVVAKDLSAAVSVCNSIAPEHLQVLLHRLDSVNGTFTNYGGLFLGSESAEVFGDYGAGPNHVLPTGGTARHSGGLSVFTFLRIRTWLRMHSPAARGETLQIAADSARLARLEGLEAHARAAETRIPPP